MVNFYVFKDGQQQWDSILKAADDRNVFQSYAWGEYKREFGWSPLRALGRNHRGETCCLLQVLVKKLPLGYSMGWAAGGPVLRFQDYEKNVLEDVLKPLVNYFSEKFPKMLLRLNSHLDHDSLLTYQFQRYLKRPVVKINSEFTIKFELDSDRLDLIKLMSSKHRYYERKSRLSEIVWKCESSDENISALLAIHSQMTEKKKMPRIALDRDNLVRLRQVMGEDCLTLLTGFIGGHPVTSCLTYDFHDRSVYMIAATNDLGRNAYAAYSMVPNLLKHLASKGIKKFDFGGIDPGNPGAAGVDHFKKGFGGSIVESLGEWEFMSSNAARLLMNFGILKSGGRV